MNDRIGARTRWLAALALILALPLTGVGVHAGAPPPAAPQWKAVGPATLRVPDRFQPDQGLGPNSGEVTGIAVDPSGARDQAIYIATNDGGIWKSADGGTSWRPTSDAMPDLSMGAVTLDPGNPGIVYAGTGNAHDPGLWFSRGVGIYRSADGGGTWTQPHADLFSDAAIVGLAAPAPNNLLVATSRGLYRSIDGGENFGTDAPGYRNGRPVVSATAVDLHLDTVDPSTVYASFFNLGLVRSTDGGASFPTTLLPSREGIVFAQSTRPDGRTIYASAGDDPRSYRLLRSTDGGATFQTLPAAEKGVPNGPASDDGGCNCLGNRTIGVDPQDPRRLYLGFRELYLSVDGGASFTNVSHGKIHFDHHALVFSPRTHWGAAPTRLYVGTDGGLATSGDGGETFVNLNEGISSSLFYGADFGRGSVANNGRIYAGAQDTGVDVRRPSDPGQVWTTGFSGDGGPPAADPNDPNRAYSSVAFLSPSPIVVTTDGGQTWSTPGGVAAVPEQDEDSTPPIAGDPAPVHTFPRIAVDASTGSPGHPSSTVYVADGTGLSRSVNADAAGAGQIRFDRIRTFPNPIMALAVHKQVVWVALRDGSVWRTSAALVGGSGSWTQVAIPGRPVLPVGALAIDAANPDRVAVGYYSAGSHPPDPAHHLYLTADGGASWQDAGAGLPDVTVNALILDAGVGADRPHTIVEGSAAGVLRSTDDGRTWAALGAGLPAVDVTSLVFDPATRTLLAGTYGRGAYELALFTPAPLPAPNGKPATGHSEQVNPTLVAGAGCIVVLVVILVWLRRQGRAR